MGSERDSSDREFPPGAQVTLLHRTIYGVREGVVREVLSRAQHAYLAAVGWVPWRPGRHFL